LTDKPSFVILPSPLKWVAKLVFEASLGRVTREGGEDGNVFRGSHDIGDSRPNADCGCLFVARRSAGEAGPSTERWIVRGLETGGVGGPLENFLREEDFKDGLTDRPSFVILPSPLG